MDLPDGTALIAFGSNLGDRRRLIEGAAEQVARRSSSAWTALSSVRETDPVGGPEQGAYLNAVGVLDTRLEPRVLLELLLDVESELGRVRLERYGPRLIDLDLLLYRDRIIDEPDLIVPHPRMLERRFVLEPCAEIAADWRHPVTERTLGEHFSEFRGM